MGTEEPVHFIFKQCKLREREDIFFREGSIGLFHVVNILDSRSNSEARRDSYPFFKNGVGTRDGVVGDALDEFRVPQLTTAPTVGADGSKKDKEKSPRMTAKRVIEVMVNVDVVEKKLVYIQTNKV